MDRLSREMAMLWRAGLSVNKAERRAAMLLLENMTEAQSKSLTERSYFYVKGGDTGTVYRVAPLSRVVKYDRRGRAIARLCFETTRSVPIADTMLAQKISLESDERHALSVANISNLRWPEYDAKDEPDLFKRRLFDGLLDSWLAKRVLVFLEFAVLLAMVLCVGLGVPFIAGVIVARMMR